LVVPGSGGGKETMTVNQSQTESVTGSGAGAKVSLNTSSSTTDDVSGWWATSSWEGEMDHVSSNSQKDTITGTESSASQDSLTDTGTTKMSDYFSCDDTWLTPQAPLTKVHSVVNTSQWDTQNTKATLVNGRLALTGFNGSGMNISHSVTSKTGPNGTLNFINDSWTDTDHVMKAGVPDDDTTFDQTQWVEGNDPVTGRYYDTDYLSYLKSQAMNGNDSYWAMVSFQNGVLDALTGGLTQEMRQGLGVDTVDYNSKAYKAGSTVGTVLSIGLSFVSPCGAVGALRWGIRALSAVQALGDTVNAVKSFSGGEILSGLTYLASAASSFSNMLRSCFTAGTPLLTPKGSKPIEQFKAGDLVLSRNEDDPAAPVMARRVLQVFVRVSPVLNLHVGGRIIGTTGEHPFYVKGKGWTTAGELRTGDVLLSHDGWEIPIQGIEDHGRIESVYNLEVEEDHTYFVGCAEWGWSVWAHNSNACGKELAKMSIAGWKKGKELVHFEKHGAGLGLATQRGYTAAAKAFAAENGPLMLVVKMGNHFFKYDQATQRILIMNNRYIKTFYRAEDGCGLFEVPNHAAFASTFTVGKS
jgi:hypothetical protein